jgi:3-deoxy-D-arabino-heptulosonate 7-phosphate (DAHP) synthase class II
MHQQEEGRKIPTLLEQPRNSILKSRSKNPFFGVSDERVGNVLAIKLISSIGTQKAIHYHDIISPMDFDGESQIILLTMGLKITITGHNLEKLFDYIIQHRVMWLKEPQQSFTSQEEKEVEIKTIKFEEQ